MNEETKNRILHSVGSQSELARRLGRKQQTVNEWLRKDRVPAVHVLRIVEITGYAVEPHELRPDVFPPGFCKSNSPSVKDG